MNTKEKLHLLPGDFIFREGEFGQTAFMIESGEVEIIKFTGDKNTVLAELKKGALFGEMAIIESSPRSASARAKTECVLTEITEERLKKYLSSSPNVALDMMRRLAVELNIPFVTTMAGAKMEVEAIYEARLGMPEPRALDISSL